jgi:hypothetical protein
MNHTDFWALMDTTSVASDGDGNRHADLLIDALATLPEQEIVDFDTLFQEHMDRAYHRNLWAAAFIIQCGCSNDGFMDFRAWLISRGQSVFENALADPESLVTVIESDNETYIIKIFAISKYAYHQKTGRDMPYKLHHVPELIGDAWDEDTVGQKYPKLHAKFGDCAGWIATFDEQT